MDVSVNNRVSSAKRGRKSPAAIGRWTRDARRPSLRITPQEVAPPVPESTAPFTLVDQAPVRRTIELHPISARETMPFMSRTSACPYLECRSSNRRCLSASPAPVSLQRQVRYCLKADHRGCKYYRKARGLAAVPPTQAAFYTAAAVTLLILILMTGIR